MVIKDLNAYGSRCTLFFSVQIKEIVFSKWVYFVLFCYFHEVGTLCFSGWFVLRYFTKWVS